MPRKKGASKSTKKSLKKSRLKNKKKSKKIVNEEEKSNFSKKSLKIKSSKKSNRAPKSVSKNSNIRDVENNEFYDESNDLNKEDKENEEFFYEEEEAEDEEEEEEEEVDEEEEEEDDDLELIPKGPIIYFQPPVLKTSTEDFKFMQFSPSVPSMSEFHLYEQVLYKAVLEISPRTNPLNVMVQVLTNQKDSRYPDGKVHSIRLHLRGPTKKSKLYVYGASSILVCAGQNFTFNYRAKHVNDSAWTNPPLQPSVKGSAKVLEMDPAYLHPQMKNLPNFHYIDKNLYIGDAIALENVPSLFFTDVLCVDADLPDPSWKQTDEKIKKIQLSTILNPNISRLLKSRKSTGKNQSIYKEPEIDESTSKKNSLRLSETEEKRDLKTTKISGIMDKVLADIDPLSLGFVAFHKIPFSANSEIPLDKYMLLEAVNWISSKLSNAKQILIVSTHCFRRAPNVVLAYLYKIKVRDTLKDCHRFMTCKRPMVLTHDLYNTIQKEFSTNNLTESILPENSKSAIQSISNSLQQSEITKISEN